MYLTHEEYKEKGGCTGLPLYVGFLDALTGIIKEEFGAAAEKFKAAMNSPRVKGYTDQYQ